MKERLTIKDWPDAERPRERLIRIGPAALSDAEVVAILLGSGSAGETAVDQAKRILAAGEREYGSGLKLLAESSVEELIQVRGLGPAKAARIKAAVELGRRLSGGIEEPLVCVRNAMDVYRLVRGDMESLDREHFCILMLNARNQVLRREVVSVGCLDSTIVHPREIFKNCIKRSAASVILVHNHPSGDPTPSSEDLEITRRLSEGGKLLGIAVLDHVIIGKGRYSSFRESGLPVLSN
ncbi:MAG: DNA repair protein RadC [Firmicutes bacterium]|nr:DNA repair protein RadC [Candidatus Fermentithermobacillaceae bacterium]